jgi:hypothetical protein
MGDGAGHAADGGKLFGFEKIALTFQEAGPHALENAGKLGDFVCATGIQRMMEIAAFESPYAFDQIGERARECVRNEEDESAADENGGKTQQE